MSLRPRDLHQDTKLVPPSIYSACGSTFDEGGDWESDLDTSPHYCSSGV
ncbi:hypothetical protein DsansV1_C15g0138321 [Dioscorea sansibarensis]